MKRNNLLDLLYRYQPTKAELEYKKRMIDFVLQHENCFERSLSVGHITASAWLLNSDRSKALVMHHAKLDLWVQPGGHCDGESNVLAVAIKEAQEESGIQHIIPVSKEIFDIDIHFIPENKKEAGHYHYDVRFLLQAAENNDFIQNSESKELRWITKNIATLPTTSETVVRMHRKWFAL